MKTKYISFSKFRFKYFMLHWGFFGLTFLFCKSTRINHFTEMVFCYQNCSSDREKCLKFEAEGREFVKI
jgi:hypothetical protein